MKKNQRIIVVNGDREVDLDRVAVKIPLSVLAQLMRDSEDAATKRIVSAVKPYISGISGRRCVENIELELTGVELVEQPVQKRLVIVDTVTDQPVEDLDFREVHQTISRYK